MLFLASQSSRRRQLLDLLQIPYQTRNGEIDETPLADETPSNYVQRLAMNKAKAVAQSVPPEAIILAADTTVSAEWNGSQMIIGKPKSPQAAYAILTQLRGRSHLVFTALALYQPSRGKIWQNICQTKVFMRSYSDNEIENYIASGDPLDKAGAYAIQHSGFHPVAKIVGCYANVMGLPLCLVAELLNSAGIFVESDIPQICLKAFSIPCTSSQCK